MKRTRRPPLIHAVFWLDVLERDALKILHLIRSWRNAVAPINRIPPEILVLIPNHWDWYSVDKDTITLTHVCRSSAMRLPSKRVG